MRKTLAVPSVDKEQSDSCEWQSLCSWFDGNICGFLWDCLEGRLYTVNISEIKHTGPGHSWECVMNHGLRSVHFSLRSIRNKVWGFCIHFQSSLLFHFISAPQSKNILYWWLSRLLSRSGRRTWEDRKCCRRPSYGESQRVGSMYYF